MENRLEPRELLRAPEDDLAHAVSVDMAVDNALAPALGQPSAHLRIVEQLVGQLVGRKSRRAEPCERAQRLRLAGRDRPGQPNEWRWVRWCGAVMHHRKSGISCRWLPVTRPRRRGARSPERPRWAHRLGR